MKYEWNGGTASVCLLDRCGFESHLRLPFIYFHSVISQGGTIKVVFPKASIQTTDRQWAVLTSNMQICIIADVQV